GRQGLPGQHVRENPVQGQKQAAIPERRQPRARETPRTRRARERPAQDLEDPPETPLLPLENRAARQGHPRIADPRGITKMEKVQWLLRTVLAGLSQRHAIFVADLASAVRSPHQFATNGSAFCTPTALVPGASSSSALTAALRAEYAKFHAH